MDLEELETEALKLSPDLRARLAEKVWQSLEALSDAENQRLWAEEALRRHDELERGAAAVPSAEDVFRNARSRLR
jgi:putative addiction module component (TIGR02574 family)